MRCGSRGLSGAALFVGALALGASASACGTKARRTPTVARSPAQAVRFYNQALVSGDYRGACRLLTHHGQVVAIADGGQAANPPKVPRPSSCAGGLKLLVPGTGVYRKLNGAHVTRVRPSPYIERRERLVTERFVDGVLEDILVTRQRGRWLLVENPYDPFS
jgi:hypothetical protein